MVVIVVVSDAHMHEAVFERMKLSLNALEAEGRICAPFHLLSKAVY